ncbi:hypothetical protein H7100_03380 [Candidatus Saccharibacteria bacterium]|nr:hypothetical protein [Candidatus Saccharibacteria bacterium]
MAATEQLPSNNAAVITANTIILPFETGPITKIMESVPTQSVDIDIRNSLIKAVLPSSEIELGVTAPNRKSIERVLGRLIGGVGFLYELDERRGFEGYFDLWVTSLISPLQPILLAKALQKLDDRVTFYVEGNIVPAF